MNRSSIFFATAGLALAATTACDNGHLTSVNNNPNNPTSVPPSTLFTNATQSSVGTWLGSGYSLRDIGLIVQHFAENQYIGNDQYKGVGPTAFQGSWNGAYATDLEDFQNVVRAGVAGNDATLWAPALIMQQWEFGYLTGNWGDVPYSQALEADSTTAILNPALDPQQQVYAGIFANLTKAASALSSASGSSLGSADPIYAGNTAKWQKFANSLHAREAIAIVNADAATASKELSAAFGGPGGTFTSNADNAQLNWPGDNIFNNPWAVNFSSRDDDRMSKTLMDTLNHYNDPRVKIYAMPASATGLYAGQPNGLTNSQAVAFSDSSSRPGAIFYPGPVAYGSGNYGGSGGKQPSYLMTFSELSFIKAEAAERNLGGLTSAQAGGFYNAAVTASMNQWGVTDQAAITAYLAQPQVAYKGGVAGLKQIALQKWIALYTDAGTAWFEWRRTCTPSLVKAKVSFLAYVPRRLVYPASESNSNGDNVQAAVARLPGGQDTNNAAMYTDKPSAAPTCQ
jgi:hypothetical protein